MFISIVFCKVQQNVQEGYSFVFVLDVTKTKSKNIKDRTCREATGCFVGLSLEGSLSMFYSTNSVGLQQVVLLGCPLRVLYRCLFQHYSVGIHRMFKKGYSFVFV